ncbi:MAG: hypothetical protein JOZ68_12570 [Acidimicrobiia bacterium]|nr:hypothetical protein [Acidimicrobiia bacterium]MBV9041835.1 hypothetical protein [Acidimicrobiia bacterium]
MVIAVFGAVLLAIGVAPRVYTAVYLWRRGESVRPALRRLYVPATAWFGLTLLVGAINHTAGGLVMLVFVAVWGTVLIVGLARGAWRLPTAVRLIGDPEAWRGNRRPYWDRGADRAP